MAAITVEVKVDATVLKARLECIQAMVAARAKRLGPLKTGSFKRSIKLMEGKAASVRIGAFDYAKVQEWAVTTNKCRAVNAEEAEPTEPRRLLTNPPRAIRFKENEG